MSENSKRILCLDFDGVCHSYTSGWRGVEVIPDRPVAGLHAFLIRALEHFRICIFSSRSHHSGGREAMIEWFDVHGMGHLPLHFPTHKTPAFLLIDDRAITFTGEWPDPQTLLNFKPWNE